MHICGMDFSSLASYWQIKALLMLEPSVVTPQNQYFPANSERMSVHCLESGCIGKYTHLGPRDFPRVGILHPSALEIALGLRPRAISRASGCKIPALGKSLGPRGVYFPIHPSSRQCTDTTSFMILRQFYARTTSHFTQDNIAYKFLHFLYSHLKKLLFHRIRVELCSV